MSYLNTILTIFTKANGAYPYIGKKVLCKHRVLEDTTYVTYGNESETFTEGEFYLISEVIIYKNDVRIDYQMIDNFGIKIEMSDFTFHLYFEEITQAEIRKKKIESILNGKD